VGWTGETTNAHGASVLATLLGGSLLGLVVAAVLLLLLCKVNKLGLITWFFCFACPCHFGFIAILESQPYRVDLSFGGDCKT
jgi:hypothetical protein